jgi:ribose/xylose/arabinose/galactoside ABC-type transport system permease subunit
MLSIPEIAEFKNSARSTELLIICVVLSGTMVSCILSPYFYTLYNIKSLLSQFVLLGLISLGMTVVVLTGNLDLSVPSIISLTSCLSAGVMQGRTNMIFWAIILALSVGFCIGLINGLIVTKLNISSIITTLATMLVFKGLLLSYTKTPIGPVPLPFLLFATGETAGIPISFLFLAFSSIVLYILLSKTRLGLHIYATGGSKEMAHLSGINNDLVILVAFVISGILSAIGGLYVTSELGLGDPLAGPGNEMTALAAVFIGGTPLTGGWGGIGGTLVGVIILTILNNILNLLSLHSYWQWVIKGTIIIGAVSIYNIKKR